MRDPTRTLRTARPANGLASALALASLALASAGCRSAPQPAAPLSASAVRLDLPLVRQDALYDCGLAAISALCQYWGVELPAEERTQLARMAVEKHGLSGDELRAALEAHGLEVFLFEGTLDRAPTGILAGIDAGRPPLVMLSPDGSAQHYELVLGYDEPRGNLILLDPMRGEILAPLALFERDWSRCRHFTLLACRRGARAADAPESDATVANRGLALRSPQPRPLEIENR